MGKKRPIIITILAVIMLIVGVMDIIFGLRFEVAPWVIGYGALAIVLSLGLFFLWTWAWYGMVLMQLFAVGYAFYDWFTNGVIDFLAIFLGIFILWYMFRSETRAVFLRQKDIPES